MKYRAVRVLIVMTVVLLATTGCSSGPSSPPAVGPGDFAGPVDVGGGRRMYLECRGTGSPTVVLIAGYGNRGSAWSGSSPGVPPPAVLPGVSGFTRVCAYDRPGTVGESVDDPVERSRSDPVPHDAAHEGYDAELRRLLPPPQLAAVLSGPSSLRSRYADFELVDADRTDALVAQARVQSPLRPMPLAVLSRGQPVEVPLPGFPVAELEQGWRGLQDDLATLVPAARHTIAARRGHDIDDDEPAMVVEAIRQTVTGVRDPDTWYGLVSCCAQHGG